MADGCSSPPSRSRSIVALRSREKLGSPTCIMMDMMSLKKPIQSSAAAFLVDLPLF